VTLRVVTVTTEGISCLVYRWLWERWERRDRSDCLDKWLRLDSMVELEDRVSSFLRVDRVRTDRVALVVRDRAVRSSSAPDITRTIALYSSP
jgi:hypothetical protein